MHLDEVAKRVRRDVIQMIMHSQSGHPGGALGAAELLSVLYFKTMRHRPEEPNWEGRDQFVLSNGHICSAMYSCLARSGYFNTQELLTFRKINSRLQGHPSRHDLPGVETASGPLGQGLSIANGMALGMRLAGIDRKVYCLVGDGEMQEGQIWEACMTSPQYKLNNLVLIVSWNDIQIDGTVTQVKNLDPLSTKLEAFGWHVLKIDGHDISDIETAFAEADRIKNKPTAIIAKTILGKGVSYMENKSEWHGKAPSIEESLRALKEIGTSEFQADLVAERGGLSDGIRKW